ncbi:hypothetical protein CC117_19220 [Parafrankia colletiae]|uniref:Uncharacterized protein n=1 Tax=Parafrankia colletiae TaxID=573497 RepID=A0A1S1QPZ3_9ACTN|nr:hypothetical protein [Parafrankia colletiae]MCK9902852.1 hypothetical protein [Frankia sp. Cpl3]OHV35777.1 hypothetical protein CC117_19220 [Parafrankia colletiae]
MPATSTSPPTASALAGGQPSPPTATPQAGTGPPGARYDEAVRFSYLDTCLRSSGGNQAYCTCTLQALESRYTQADYLRVNAAPDSPEARRIIKEIYAACRALRSAAPLPPGQHDA